jgi:hypothetical protein
LKSTAIFFSNPTHLLSIIILPCHWMNHTRPSYYLSLCFFINYSRKPCSICLLKHYLCHARCLRRNCYFSVILLRQKKGNQVECLPEKGIVVSKTLNEVL